MAVPDVLPERGGDREAALGTRFLVYPQPPYVPGYEKPETIWVSTPSGQVEAGPSDNQIYVVVPAIVVPFASAVATWTVR